MTRSERFSLEWRDIPLMDFQNVCLCVCQSYSKSLVRRVHGILETRVCVKSVASIGIIVESP